MPRVAKASKPADSTANLGFEAAVLRSPQGDRWLAAGSRGEAKTAEGNRSNNSGFVILHSSFLPPSLPSDSSPA